MMKSQMIKLARVLTFSACVFTSSVMASNQGGSVDNLATSAETGLTGSTQVASVVVTIPVMVVAGGALAVASAADETVDWALGEDQPLPLTDKTLVADKDPAAVMAEKGGQGRE